MSRQIVRVEVEDSEGEIQYLVGPEAERWQRQMERLDALADEETEEECPALNWQVRWREETERR